MERRIKDGVRLQGINPVMVIADAVVASCFEHAGAYCMITSCTDGPHSDQSLHYAGLALDYRTNHITPALAEGVAHLARERLGDGFDVVLEQTHIHVEYDPK